MKQLLHQTHDLPCCCSMVSDPILIGDPRENINSFYMDYYANLTEAVADTRTFYAKEGYEVEAVEVDQLPRWPNTEPVPTLVVRLSNIAKQPQP